MRNLIKPAKKACLRVARDVYVCVYDHGGRRLGSVPRHSTLSQGDNIVNYLVDTSKRGGGSNRRNVLGSYRAFMTVS